MRRFAVCLSSRPLRRCLPAFFLGFTVSTSAALAQSTLNTQYFSSSNDASNQSLDQGLLSYHAQEGGQNSGGYGRGGYKQYPSYGQPGFHHLAIEAGAGFSSPTIGPKGTVFAVGTDHILRAYLTFTPPPS